MRKPKVGRCMACGCTYENACDGGCAWANREQTVCTTPSCVAKVRLEALRRVTKFRAPKGSIFRKTRVVTPAERQAWAFAEMALRLKAESM